MKREFVKEPVSNFIKPEEYNIFYHLITNRTIACGLESGGWIAGGFARTILAGESIVEYLYPKRPKYSEFRQMSSDIDIFFPNQESASKAMPTLESISRGKVELGMDRFAVDWHIQPSNKLNELFEKEIPDYEKRFNSTRVQFVVKPPSGFKPTLLETINDFDLVNCMVGIDGQYIYYPVEWAELEETKTLKISKSNTPFLGRRLAKYINARGYENISESSRDLFVEWIARVHSDEFPSVFNSYHKRKEMMMTALNNLISNKAMPLTDVVMFIDKWKVTRKEESGEYGLNTYITVDWALETLNEHREKNIS